MAGFFKTLFGKGNKAAHEPRGQRAERRKEASTESASDSDRITPWPVVRRPIGMLEWELERPKEPTTPSRIDEQIDWVLRGLESGIRGSADNCACSRGPDRVGSKTR